MSNREGCPTLTEEGRHLLEQDIKNAVTKFIIYGVKKDNPTEAQELLKLIENKQVTSEMLTRYIVVDKRPISGFFDVDGKLTYMFQVAYTDVKEELRGKIAIYGIGLLNEEGKIVTLYPDDGIILDGDQANYRGTIKIHSVVGTPGTVTYYTGEYITREEYEAAKVPMVEKVLDETGKRFKPLLDNAITDFENQTTHQLANQQNDYQEFKASAQRQLDLIQEQATADLTGMQEFVVKLIQMARLEGYFDQSLHVIENSLARFSKKLDNLFDFLLRIKQELNEMGKIVFFPHKLPDDYILLNKWYPKNKYLLFVNHIAPIKMPKNRIQQDREGNFRFYYTINKYSGSTNFFYAKASLEEDDLNIYDTQRQSLPKPYIITSGEHSSSLQADWFVTTLAREADKGNDIPGKRNHIRNWLAQWELNNYPGLETNGNFYNKLWRVQINLSEAVAYMARQLNTATYKEDYSAEVHPANITYVAGMKAKLSFDYREELAKILDEPTYVY